MNRQACGRACPEPAEVSPVPQLILQFRLARFTWNESEVTNDVVSDGRCDISDFTIMDTLNKLTLIDAIPILINYDYHQTLLIGLVSYFAYFSYTGGIHS